MIDEKELAELTELVNENDDFITGFLKGINSQPETKEAIDSLMALPDEKFDEVKGTFLGMLAEGFNTPEFDEAIYTQSVEYGVSSEDLINGYEEICKQIDGNEALKDLSETKRDFYKAWILLYINAVSRVQNSISHLVKIPVELCHENAKVPTYANSTDAGLDIYAVEDITIHPGETKLIHTGIKVAIPAGYELQVRPKSGKTLKTKFRVGNAPGTIDSGYRDEVCVIIDNIEPPIKNISTEPVMDEAGHVDHLKVLSIEYGSNYSIGKGEKIAQLVLSQVPRVSFFETDDISAFPNDGRNGGFGSTGDK